MRYNAWTPCRLQLLTASLSVISISSVAAQRVWSGYLTLTPWITSSPCPSHTRSVLTWLHQWIQGRQSCTITVLLIRLQLCPVQMSIHLSIWPDIIQILPDMPKTRPICKKHALLLALSQAPRSFQRCTSKEGHLSFFSVQH